MITWLSQNIPTVIICTALLLIVVWIIFGMVKDKKKGKSSCGGSCGSCPMSGKCHPPK